ncbi:hypothetical protein OG21DRAFT_379019 [Imleria badia]|nr:hypothetical protein OG21DRAFT_379019 [Imleria badia]
MQNGQVIPANGSEPESWKLWLPGPTTELTQMFNTAEQAFDSLSLACIQASPDNQQCDFISAANMYMNNLLGIPWVFGSAATAEVLPSSIMVESKQFEDAVANMTAAFIWLASTFDIGPGIQQVQGQSSITSFVLDLRLNINTTPVAFGLFASIMLFATMAWMLHDSYPRMSKIAITSVSLLELMWISIHSTTLQDFMTRTNTSMSDQLRIEGMKIELCLLNLDTGIKGSDKDNILNLSSTTYSPNWQQFIAEGQSSMYLWCYVLHGILFALHVVLLLLLIYHPEHDIIMPVYNTWLTTVLSVGLQAFYVLYTATLVFIVQQLATSKLIAQRHYLTTVHDTANAWTGIGAAVYSLFQQTGPSSSIWVITGVVLYLACVSVMHIASTTIMQFTAYNHTSTISVQTLVPWPNSTVISNGSWLDAIQTMPPISLIDDLQTNGLLNNTIYDIITPTIQSSFTNATVNATSLQASCGLLSNLSYYNSSSFPGSGLNFSVDGLGQGSLALVTADPIIEVISSAVNQVVSLQLSENDAFDNCTSCDQYFFFFITANIEVNESVTINATDLSYNIAQDGGPPIMAYIAACSLISQTTSVTLDLQTNDLIPSFTQTGSQSWMLWSPEMGGSLNFTNDANGLIENTPFMTCPTNGGICSMSTSVSLPTQNSSLYTLTPNQLQQTIEQLVAAKIWMGISQLQLSVLFGF